MKQTLKYNITNKKGRPTPQIKLFTCILECPTCTSTTDVENQITALHRAKALYSQHLNRPVTY